MRDQRFMALGLLEGGSSERAVARRFGCSNHTIRALVQRHQTTGSIEDRPRPGRERVTTPGQDRRIVLQHLRERFRTATETAQDTPGRYNP